MRWFLAASFLAFAGLACAQSDSASWKPLYNGKDLSGWEHVGPGGFTIEDKLLKTQGGMGLLYFKNRQFGDGDMLRVVFKTTSERSNSGVYIRFPDRPLDPWYAVHFGYEVQIDGAGDDWHCTGAIYSLSKVSERRQLPPGEWNTMEIHFEGPDTIVFLNGKQVNRFNMYAQVPPRAHWFEPVRGPRSNHGYIGLQNHDEHSTVYFKQVSFQGR